MTELATFQFSEAESRKLRRGAFLPLLVILPMAAMFAFDDSKSQPSHFLLTFGMGLVFGTVIVLIGRAGANNRIAQLSNTELSVEENRLIWRSNLGKTELLLSDVVELRIHRRGRKTRTIRLKLQNGSTTQLEGYDEMDRLAEVLGKQVTSCVVTQRGWLHF